MKEIVTAEVHKLVFCFSDWRPKTLGRVIYDSAALPFTDEILDCSGYLIQHLEIGFADA